MLALLTGALTLVVFILITGAAIFQSVPDVKWNEVKQSFYGVIFVGILFIVGIIGELIYAQ